MRGFQSTTARQRFLYLALEKIRHSAGQKRGNMAFSISSASSGKGIACMVLGGLLLTINDAIQKWMTADFPTGQLLAVRAVFMLIPIAFFIWRAGGRRALKVVNIRGQALRAVLVCTSSFLFVGALSLMPLADAIAVTFAGPLFVTALAPVLLKEFVGWRRWLAVLTGFLGVIVIVNPSSSNALRWVALLPLGVALCGAIRDIATRHMHGTETTAGIMFYSTLAVIIVGSATFPFGWAPISPVQYLMFAVNGVVFGAAHFFLVEALRLAEASVVAPFKYVTLIWAILIGMALWQDMPDMRMFVGALLVVASGLYILHRELHRNA
jgi:drug/metabolite transporter (DMT)-like permease